MLLEKVRKKMVSPNQLALMMAVSAMASTTSAHAGGVNFNAFYGPICTALTFFTGGDSPLVAFILMGGGFGILVTLLMGEDRGMLMNVIKWLAGGAGLVGITSLVSGFFGLDFCNGVGQVVVMADALTALV